ncbi:MAG: hypothetical protein LBV00_00805, partial [Propionibacteriaceae bacterium]|nr:hypothetical protein [Propionibacteriaceae bacterium]
MPSFPLIDPSPVNRYRRRRRAARPTQLQLAQVTVPSEIPNVAAVFIVLRKMRRPFLLILGIMTFTVIGLSLMPGTP